MRGGPSARAVACVCVALACIAVSRAPLGVSGQRLKVGVTVNSVPMEILLAPTDDPTRVATAACAAAFPLPTPDDSGVAPPDDADALRRDCVQSLAPLVARKQQGDVSVREEGEGCGAGRSVAGAHA